MGKRNLTYYLKTIRLKANALRLRLTANSPSQQRNRTVLKAKHLAAFAKLNEANIGLENQDQYYYTYSHFSHPEQLANSLLFDKAGIAYSSVNNPHLKYINPLFPAYYGLVCYNHYSQTDDFKSRQELLKQVDFLKGYGKWEGDFFKLYYEFDYPAFNLKAPWVAGITQALAASIFYRAHLLEPERGYDKYLTGAIKTMFIPKEAGGLLCTTKEGLPWIEEYPSEPPSMVLNGFIFCIVAVIEYANFKNDEFYKKQSVELLRSLVSELHQYKYGKFLRHNLKHWDLSNLEYQGLYVFQFTHLYRLTGLPLFRELAIELEQAFTWKDFFYFYQMNNRNIVLRDYLNKSKP